MFQFIKANCLILNNPVLALDFDRLENPMVDIRALKLLPTFYQSEVVLGSILIEFLNRIVSLQLHCLCKMLFLNRLNSKQQC